MSASPLARLRAGLVVPRYGHSAVDRNRLKRRLRELVRNEVLPLGEAVDLVIWAQRSAYRLAFDQLQREVQQVIAKLQRMPREMREDGGGMLPLGGP